MISKYIINFQTTIIVLFINAAIYSKLLQIFCFLLQNFLSLTNINQGKNSSK